MILIVDDKPENIFSLKKILELNNFEVDSALSGEEALKKILKNSYALIILDVQMPGMDGFEVAENISGYSKSKDIPIIFLSAVNTEKKFITRGYASGGIDYITKPVDPDILILKVKTLHRLYEQTRELNEAQYALRAEIEFRKQAQSELRERVQELRSILESIPQIAFTATSNGKIEFVNQHWFNYSSADDFPQAHPDDANIRKRWEKTVADNVPLELEVRIKKLNEETYRFHLLRATPVMEGNVVVKWVGTFTDIEEQKQAEKRKDEFLSIASHELKTPLTSIKAYIQLLERSFEKHASPREEAGKYLRRTQFQIDKLHNLIADLLDISKIESGKLKFNKKVFDFEPVLENTIDIIRQTNSDFNITRKGSANVKIYGDDIRLEQVILNYLTNAIKYSPENKEVFVESHITDDNQLLISVKDYGVGIPTEKQKNIFKKFYRVEETSHRFQGLGIGLYICSEIIKRHNGSLGVESEPGNGSAFYFSIPVFNEDEELIQEN